MSKDWEIIKDNGRQRVYQLMFDVRYFKSPGDKIRTIDEIFTADSPNRLGLTKNLEVIEDIDNTRSINKVCVSDAHTHVERLVFPVLSVGDKNTGKEGLFIWYIDIDGYITRMDGDDNWNTVHPDEVYLRHLKLINRRRTKKE